MSDFSQITVDQVRSYWDRRPCNIRHSPKPVGTRDLVRQIEALLVRNADRRNADQRTADQ